MPQALLQDAIGQSSESVLMFDLHGTITFWNAGAEAIYGYSSQAMLGKSIKSIIPENRQMVFENAIQLLLAQHVLAPREMTRVAASGVQFQVRSSLQLIRNPDGVISGFLEFSGAMTAVSQTSDQACQNLEPQSFATMVLESIDQGVLYGTMDFKIEYASPPVAKMFGYEVGQFIGQDIFSFIHPDDASAVLQIVQELYEGWQPKGHLRGVRADGSLIHLEIRAFPRLDASNTLIGSTVLVRDVTLETDFADEFKQIKQQLEQERQFALDVTASVKEGLVKVNAQGVVEYANAATANIAGVSQVSDLLGINPIDLVLPDEQAATKAHWKKLVKGEVVTYTHGVVRPDGLACRVEITVYPKLDAHQRFSGAIMVVADVTQKLELQAVIDRERDWSLHISQTIAQGYAVVNQRWEIEYANTAMARILGIEARALVGLLPIVLVPPDQRQALRDDIKRATQGETRVYRHQIQRPNDTVLRHVEVELYPKLGANQQFHSAIIIVTDITENVALEQASHTTRRALDRESRIGLLVANATLDGLAFINQDYIFEYVNPAWAQIMGYASSRELLGSSSKIWIDADLDLLKRYDAELEAGQSLTYTFQARRTDGRLILVENKSFPIFEDNQYRGFIAVMRDVTATAEQQRQRGIAASIAGIVSQGLAVLDRRGLFEFVNPALEKLLQRDKTSLIGQEFLSIFEPEERRRFEQLTQGLSPRQTSRLYSKIQRPDQSLIRFEIAYYPQENTDGSVLVFTNLTDQISQELEVMRVSNAVLEHQTQMQIQEQKTRLIAESIHQCVGVFDRDGRIEYVNPAYARMLGYDDPEALLGCPEADLMLPEDSHILAQAMTARKNRLSTTYTIRMLDANQQTLEVEVTGYPRFVADQYLGSVSVTENVAKRQQEQRELVQKAERYKGLLEQSQQYAKQITLIDQVHTAVLQASTSQELMQAVVNSIHSVLGFEMVSIYMIIQDQLVLQHYIGYQSVITHFPVSGNGVMVRVVRQKQTIVVDDAALDSDFVYPQKGVQSELCVPIIIGQEVVGVLNLEAPETFAFNTTDQHLLEQISERIGSKIQSTQIVDQLRILENAVQSSRELILITDSQLEFPGPKIIYVNNAILEQTGYTREELLGRTPRIFQGTQTSREMLIELKQSLQQGFVYRANTTNYRKDGSSYQVQWQISPVRDEKGQITHFVSVQNDITDRLKLEQLIGEFGQTRHKPDTSPQTIETTTKLLLDMKTYIGNMQWQLKHGQTMRGNLESLGGGVVLMQMLSISGSSGAIGFRGTQRILGTLHLKLGRIVAVEHPQLRGKLAVINLLGKTQGEFDFTADVNPPNTDLDLDPTALVLELAQKQDENLEQQKQTVATTSNRLVLPNLEAAQGFMRGVGGESYFKSSLQLFENQQKLIFTGRGFELVVLDS